MTTLERNGISWKIVDDGTLDTVVRVTREVDGKVESEEHRFSYFGFWDDEVEEDGEGWEERRDEEIETTLASMWVDGDLFTRRGWRHT